MAEERARRARRSELSVLALVAQIAAAVACTPAVRHTTTTPSAAPYRAPTQSVLRAAGRPPLATLVRDGDPLDGLAAAVTTEGIAPERGATVAVALGAVVQARLRARGWSDVAVVPQADGFRVRGWVQRPADAAATAALLRAALLDPVSDADRAAALVKLTALGNLRAVPRALAPVAACDGRVVRPPPAALPSVAELDAWRKAAGGLGRVAWAAVGPDAFVRSVAAGLTSGPAWPDAAPLPPEAAPTTDLAVYDASDDGTPGTTRVSLTLRLDAARAPDAAASLGARDGALVARLRATEPAARVESVIASTHARSACISVTLRAPADARKAPARVAALVDLAQHEMSIAAAEPSVTPPPLADPRDAAEQGAVLALAELDDRAVPATPGPVAIGLDTARAAPTPADLEAARDALRRELERVRADAGAPVVQGRAAVERGQREAYVLVASACGVTGETSADAGLSAAFAVAVARHARRVYRVEADPWVAADGVGVVVHASARPQESPGRLARRIADAAARSFAVDDMDSVPRAQGVLLGEASPALSTLAVALSPAAPSSLLPTGTVAGLRHLSPAAVAARAEALRRGPLRAVVLANDSHAQGDEALRAIDRWVERTPGPRTCPAAATTAPPRAGTYAVETDGASEAYLGASFRGETAPAAPWIAAILGGHDGLLARALGDGLARSFDVRSVGPASAPALVVHVDAPGSALDAAVTQVRALFARVAHGALTDADLARARTRAAADARKAMLDPRARAIALWRGTKDAPPPALARLKADAASALKDDALVIVAARPPIKRSP